MSQAECAISYERTCADVEGSIFSHPVIRYGRSLMTGKFSEWTQPTNSIESRGVCSPTMMLLSLTEEREDWDSLALHAAVAAERICAWNDAAEIERLKWFMARAQERLGLV